MSLSLYFAPGACSFVPHTLLQASGADFEPRLVKLHKGEQFEAAYQALNPRGQVPVLVEGDQVMTQIIAISLYLDAKFPQCGFLPASGWARAKALETLAWMNNTVHPTFTHVFRPGHFSDDAAAQASIKTKGVENYRLRLKELQQLVAALPAAGATWLSGPHFGPLDAYALTLSRWGTLAGIMPAEHPVLWDYVHRVAQHPPVQQVIERERIQLQATPI